MVLSMIIVILRLSLTLLPFCVSLWSVGGCGRKKKEQKKDITSSMIGAASELRIENQPLPKVTGMKNQGPTSIIKGEPIRKESDKAKEEEPQETKKDENEKNKSCKIIPYPEVKEPTLSQKKKREEELNKEKKDKIAKGFYQSKSDEDDTLEKINSLKEEESEKSKKNQSAKYKSKQG